MGEQSPSCLTAGLLLTSVCTFRRGDRSMLASFSGRPQDISPKARYHMWMGKFFPNTYA